MPLILCRLRTRRIFNCWVIKLPSVCQLFVPLVSLLTSILFNCKFTSLSHWINLHSLWSLKISHWLNNFFNRPRYFVINLLYLLALLSRGNVAWLKPLFAAFLWSVAHLARLFISIVLITAKHAKLSGSRVAIWDHFFQALLPPKMLNLVIIIDNCLRADQLLRNLLIFVKDFKLPFNSLLKVWASACLDEREVSTHRRGHPWSRAAESSSRCRVATVIRSKMIVLAPSSANFDNAFGQVVILINEGNTLVQAFARTSTIVPGVVQMVYLFWWLSRHLRLETHQPLQMLGILKLQIHCVSQIMWIIICLVGMFIC